MSNRRKFLQSGITAVAAAPFARLYGRQRTRSSHNAARFSLGVASYSLRKLSREAAIDAVRELQVRSVSVKSFHLPYDLPPSELQAAANQFREAGLELVSSGNNNIKEDSDEHVRTFFDYARTAGIPMLVITTKPKILPRIEQFVREYDIKIAIHNHGPEDDDFPAPSDALRHLQGLDPRMGVCVDVGHTARTGGDVIGEIRGAGDRLLDMHMKDLRDLSDKESQCAIGDGAMPVAEIFKQLAKMDYHGDVNLEYEIHPENPVPGMVKSMAYMRGVRAGMAL